MDALALLANLIVPEAEAASLSRDFGRLERIRAAAYRRDSLQARRIHECAGHVKCAIMRRHEGYIQSAQVHEQHCTRLAVLLGV